MSGGTQGGIRRCSSKEVDFSCYILDIPYGTMDRGVKAREEEALVTKVNNTHIYYILLTLSSMLILITLL